MAAAASAFCAWVCASPAISAAGFDLGGYVRVMSNGQERFCDKEEQGHFLLYVCYTRPQLKEKLLARRRAAGLSSAAGEPVLVPPTSFYIASGRPGR